MSTDFTGFRVTAKRFVSAALRESRWSTKHHQLSIYSSMRVILTNFNKNSRYTTFQILVMNPAKHLPDGTSVLTLPLTHRHRVLQTWNTIFKKCPSRIYYKSSYICSHRAIYTYQSVICCSERPSKRSRNEAFDRDPKPCEICALNSKYSRSYVNLKKWVLFADIGHDLVLNHRRMDSGPGIRPFLSLVFMVK